MVAHLSRLARVLVNGGRELTSTWQSGMVCPFACKDAIFGDFTHRQGPSQYILQAAVVLRRATCGTTTATLAPSAHSRIPRRSFGDVDIQ